MSSAARCRRAGATPRPPNRAPLGLMYAPPAELRAEVFARLPERLHLSGRRSGWIDGNRPGQRLHSFLEGPSFGPDGRLWLVDIPFGRISRSRRTGRPGTWRWSTTAGPTG